MKKTTKLKFRPETIRQLSNDDLGNVAGGATTIYTCLVLNTANCATANCATRACISAFCGTTIYSC